MLSTTLVLSTLGALASASSNLQLFARQNLNLTVVNVTSLGVPIDCLTTSQVISVSPACAQACQTEALQADTACAFEDLTCQCAHNTAVGNVIGPCLAINSTCSPAVLTAFDNDFNAICAVRNATAASGKKPQCSSSSSAAWTTSTVYSTSTYTVTSCAPTVTNCPAHSTKVVTSVVAVSTTVCPVTQTWPAPTWSSPAAPQKSSWAPISSSPAAPVKPSSAAPWPTPSPSKGAGYNQTSNSTWSTTGSGVTMFQGAAPKTAISSIAALAGIAMAALML